MKKLHAIVIAGALAGLAVPLRADAAHGEQSFTPLSLKVPLYGVRLGGTDMSRDAMIYRCTTPGDCNVDMADDLEVSSLFTGTTDIAPGTYDHVTFDTCAPGDSQYTVFVRGSVVLAGTTYFTTSGAGDFLTSDASLAAFAPLPYAGCSATIPLPAPITIAESDTPEVNAFFSLANIAWGALGSNGIGGCASNAHQSVCAGYPIPVAYFGSVQPTISTFYVTEDVTDLTAAKASGQILLLRDSRSVAFGGFSRRLYSETSENPHVNYDTPLKEVVKNLDAQPSYTIMNWGGGSSSGLPSPYYVKFSTFQLATHQSTMVGPDSDTPIPYRAVLQAP